MHIYISVLGHFTLRNPYLDISLGNVSWSQFSTLAIFLAIHPQIESFFVEYEDKRLGKVTSNNIPESDLFWRSPRENLPLAFMKGEHSTFLSMALGPFYHGTHGGSYWEAVTIKTRIKTWFPWHHWLNSFEWSLRQDTGLWNSEGPVYLPLRFSAKHPYTIGNYHHALDGNVV